MILDRFDEMTAFILMISATTLIMSNESVMTNWFGFSFALLSVLIFINIIIDGGI